MIIRKIESLLIIKLYLPFSFQYIFSIIYNMSNYVILYIRDIFTANTFYYLLFLLLLSSF